MQRSCGEYSITTVDRSGCSVTGHMEVTSSQENRTFVQPRGAGKVSKWSTGWRTVAPRIVSPSVAAGSVTPTSLPRHSELVPARTRDARPAHERRAGVWLRLRVRSGVGRSGSDDQAGV